MRNLRRRASGALIAAGLWLVKSRGRHTYTLTRLSGGGLRLDVLPVADEREKRN